jgi:hypothetical protein
VSSDVTVRDVGLLPGGEREEGCDVRDLLIYTGNSPSLLLVIDYDNMSLKVFNVDTWRCVSRCVLDSPPVCMYELSGSVFIHCNDRGLYRVTSMSPLAVTRHGQTGVVYSDIAALDDTRLIAVSPYSPRCIHVLGHRGKLIADITKTCDSYCASEPWRIRCHAGRVIVLDGEYPHHPVVCMRVSPDNQVTHEWTVEDLGGTWDVLITAGVLLVTCIPAPTVISLDMKSAPTVISLDMKSGRVLERVKLTRDTNLGVGLCVDEATSRVYAGMVDSGVAELNIQGKL